MTRQGRWSLLRRSGTPAGGLALLCLVLAAPVQAAPSPDPPPVAVAPEPPPVARTQPAQVRSPVTTPSAAPVIDRIVPVTRAQSVQKPAAKPKPKPAARKPVAQKQPVAASERAQPHDRKRVPLAALVVVDELNRGLLAFGGALLLVTTLSGGMVLWAGRRVLKEGTV